MMKETSKWWWIKSHNTSNSSPWLNSTLSELDAKTNEILNVIDEVDDEADSFVKRAKIYYERKPKLIAMVEDLYRSHRSLAHKHDLLIKTSSTCNEFQSEVLEDDGEKGESEEDQVGDNGETMKEELERLREENRVYKEIFRENRKELFRDSIRICFRVFHFLPFQLGFVLLFSPFAFLFTNFNL